jgi:hypothetical protein
LMSKQILLRFIQLSNNILIAGGLQTLRLLSVEHLLKLNG